MDESQIKLIGATLAKADKKLKTAKLLLKEQEYDDSASRAYYAAFHAAQAVLFSEGFEADSHYGLKMLFGLNFVKAGKIEVEYGKLLSNLKDDREEGDYDVVSFIDRETAEKAVKEAEKFVARMKIYLEKHIGEPTTGNTPPKKSPKT